jgi:hypothetical protein
MDTLHCEWKYVLHFNNIWRIPNDWNENLIFTEDGINFEKIPNYLSISLIKNDEKEDNDCDDNENDSVS